MNTKNKSVMTLILGAAIILSSKQAMSNNQFSNLTNSEKQDYLDLSSLMKNSKVESSYLHGKETNVSISHGPSYSPKQESNKPPRNNNRQSDTKNPVIVKTGFKSEKPLKTIDSRYSFDELSIPKNINTHGEPIDKFLMAKSRDFHNVHPNETTYNVLYTNKYPAVKATYERLKGEHSDHVESTPHNQVSTVVENSKYILLQNAIMSIPKEYILGGALTSAAAVGVYYGGKAIYKWMNKPTEIKEQVAGQDETVGVIVADASKSNNQDVTLESISNVSKKQVDADSSVDHGKKSNVSVIHAKNAK